MIESATALVLILVSRTITASVGAADDVQERNHLVERIEEVPIPRDVPSQPERQASILGQEQRSRKEIIYLWLWRTFRVFVRDDVKFAIKVGVGASLYASPSFFTYTRPFYQHWRGEW